MIHIQNRSYKKLGSNPRNKETSGVKLKKNGNLHDSEKYEKIIQISLLHNGQDPCLTSHLSMHGRWNI